MPARLRTLIRALAKFNVSIEEPSSGSHFKARDASGKMYPIPAPNGEKSEIDEKYIRGLCRTFNIDYKEFLSKL